MKILVAYATRHGSTREVAEAVAASLRRCGHAVELASAAETLEIEGYELVVLGGALYVGRLHRDAVHFLERHRSALAERPFAVFAMGPKTVDDSEVAASRAQLERVLERFGDVSASSIAIFGGVIDPAGLRFPFALLPDSDARDWAAIEDWARSLGDLEARVPAGL
jgi:menaquinone-dependent protoporphyrinogen oxidase